MDQQQTDLTGMQDLNRPAILEDLSATQLSELEAQADEGDRQGFNWRAESFGWTPEQAEQVWSWLTQRPRSVTA